MQRQQIASAARQRAAALAATLLAAACSEDAPRGELLQRTQLGDAWPLSLDSVRVDCVDASSAVAYDGATTYALNATARSRGHADIEPVWRPDPKVPGLRVDISPLTDRALAPCTR